MRTIAATIVHISRNLNDQDATIGVNQQAFVRWPASDLLQYLNNGLKRIAAMAPYVNIVGGTINIGYGTRFQLPNNMLELIDVHYASVSINNVNYFDRMLLSRVNSNILGTYDKTSCLSNRVHYRPYNWAYDPVDQKAFFIHPPVPVGVSIILTVTYRRETPEFNDPNSNDMLPFSDRYDTALHEWMYYEAYSVDQESASSMANAKLHLEQFNIIMSGIVARDKALHDGTLLQEGRIK